MGIDYPNWLLSWFGFFIFVISTTPSRPARITIKMESGFS